MLYTKGKGNRIRVVPFGPKTEAALRRYLRARGRHRLSDLDALWLTERGPMRRSTLGQMLDRYGASAVVERAHAAYASFNPGERV